LGTSKYGFQPIICKQQAHFCPFLEANYPFSVPVCPQPFTLIKVRSRPFRCIVVWLKSRQNQMRMLDNRRVFFPGSPSSSSLRSICNFQLNRSPQYHTSIGINRYLNRAHRRCWPSNATRCSDPPGCGCRRPCRTLVPLDNRGSMCSIRKQHQMTIETMLAILQVLPGYKASF
jgi:hypothetical protein